MLSLERLQAWCASVEDAFWAAHNEVMNATGARVFLDAAAAAPSLSIGSLVGGFLRAAYQFYAAVNWSEPFFRYLAAFHIIVWVATLTSTWGAVSDERIMGVCAVLGVLLLSGIPANSYAGRHAERLFQEPGVNYFTEDGTMMMVVYLLPLLVLFAYLQLRQGYRIVSLMLQLKRAQLRRQLRQEARRKDCGDSCSGDAAGESKKTQ
ncbi:putative Transmembrane protein 18 [Leishmania shawi]|uniref:Transmembrane protein 18 n=1 Tax=Leishmania shawi TaxID=5680 RepID=A0AAW3BGZ4_9TRYP